MNQQSPRRNHLIVVIIALGLLFLALSFFLTPSSSGPEAGLKLATLVRQTGRVEVIRAGLTQRSKVETRSDLGNSDSVETFEIGEADLIFENGCHVRVFENSLITLDRVNEADTYHVVLLIQRGDVRVDQVGHAHDLFISKNGQPIEASLYNDSELHRAPLVEKSSDQLSNENPATLPSLSEEEIATTMNLQRSSFFRCYTKLVQKNPRVTGEATLTFTIDNTGKPTLINLALQMKPPTTDEDFVKCLKDVIQRISFKAFSGPAVSTIFPLKFE